MKTKAIFIKYLLPALLLFFGLSFLHNIPIIQQSYYPFFEKYTLYVLDKGQPDMYFKANSGSEDSPKNFNKITVLYNSRKRLQAARDKAEANGVKGRYEYTGFIVNIDETYITPLLFFITLVLISPVTLTRKILAIIIGSSLIFGFNYWVVHFMGLHLVAESGLKDTPINLRQRNLYELLHQVFNEVTSVSVVIFIWLLTIFRKGDLKLLKGDLKR